MNLRPPGLSHRGPATNALDYEIGQEQAAALGRMGRALEAALTALSEHDRAGFDAAPAAGTRGRLVGEAGYAL